MSPKDALAPGSVVLRHQNPGLFPRVHLEDVNGSIWFRESHCSLALYSVYCEVMQQLAPD